MIGTPKGEAAKVLIALKIAETTAAWLFIPVLALAAVWAILSIRTSRISSGSGRLARLFDFQFALQAWLMTAAVLIAAALRGPWALRNILSWNSPGYMVFLGLSIAISRYIARRASAIFYGTIEIVFETCLLSFSASKQSDEIVRLLTTLTAAYVILRGVKALEDDLGKIPLGPFARVWNALWSIGRSTR